MDLPAVFYGPYRDVKRRTSKIVTQVRKRADWIALVEAEGFLDTASTPGLIVLAGPSALLGGEPHFQQWLLWQQIFFGNLDISTELADDVFLRSLTRPWSTLGMVGSPYVFWSHPERYRPFLSAVLPYWPLFDAAGPRYTDGSRTPAGPWSVAAGVKYVLANLGIPGEALRVPLPPGGLATLIERTEQNPY
jgi:hypothetical protein